MTPRPLPAGVLERPVTGVNLTPGTLGDQLAAGPNLLIFLRHFGCIFCRETVADLRSAVDQIEGYPKVIFFFQGSSTEGRVFLSRYWPDACAIADRGKAFYREFGIHRGNLRELFGREVWREHRRAAAKGHSLGRPSSDPLMMPGVFWVEDGEVRWQHQFRHAGDHPDWAAIPGMIRDARPRTRLEGATVLSGADA